VFNSNFDGEVTEFKVPSYNIAVGPTPTDPVTIKAEDLKNYTFKTNSSGNIELKEIIPVSGTDDIELTITETSVPTDGTGYYYKLIDKPIKIKLSKQDDYELSLANGYEVVDFGTTTKKLEELVETENHKTAGKIDSRKVIIKNVSFIDLSGQVWLDGQNADKAGTPGTNLTANGRRDWGEAPVEGINVFIEDLAKDEIILIGKTDASGKYSKKELERTTQGYKILFEYDGINYEDTYYTTDAIVPVTSGNDSDAKELKGGDDWTRTRLVERFETIDIRKTEYQFITKGQIWNIIRRL